MDQIGQFSDAIVAGAAGATPGSYIPELANFYQGSFRGAAVDGATKGLAGAAQLTAEEEERKRKAAAAAAAARMDPSKYQKVRKDDGGFAFFDPDGTEIDIHTYAKHTGQRRVDILKDSENPVDLQYIDDYEQMNDISQAIWRNDSEAIQEYQQLFPDLFGDRSPTPEDLSKRMLEKYPHIYGMGQYEVSRSNLGNPLFRAADFGSTTKKSSGSGWRPS